MAVNKVISCVDFPEGVESASGKMQFAILNVFAQTCYSCQTIKSTGCCLNFKNGFSMNSKKIKTQFNIAYGYMPVESTFCKK